MRSVPTVLATLAVLALGLPAARGAVSRPGPIDWRGELNGATLTW